MAITIVSVNTTVAGTAASLSVAGDDLYIDQGVRLTSTGGLGVNVTADNTTTFVDGTLTAGGRAYSATNALSRLFVGETGKVVSFNEASNEAGVVMFGANCTVSNAGQISALQAIAIYFGGTDSDLVNQGSIRGTTGIQVSGTAQNARLLNSGSIVGSGAYDGTQDFYEGRGILVQALNGYLYNSASGFIGSTAAGGTGIFFSGNAGGGQVENHGEIAAMTGVGVSLAEVFLGQSVIRVQNFGTISGQTNSYIGSINADALVNRGTMQGYLEMGSGNDTLDNRNGQIDLTVTLSDGDDLLLNRGGQISDSVYMGSGNDVLDNRGGRIDGVIYGEGGADRFILNPNVGETVEGGAELDTIDFRSGPAVVLALDGSFDNAGAALGDVFTGIERVFGSSTQADLIRGSGGVNQLYGYGGNDTLEGGGGADVLLGGLGNDTFRFLSLAEIGDKINDFSNVSGNNDRIELKASGFGGGLVAGTAAANIYIARADNQAQDADDRFVLRTTDKTLWFDADGNGAGAAVMVADLQNTAVFSRLDILIF